MLYDHHRKAGNEGDCVKHPALIAGLDTVLKTNETKLFRYLDVFAGHAWHPLLDGDEYEWTNGIGKLAPVNRRGDAPDSVKCWWGMWHDAPEWPTISPPGYPGSSWIAAHRCRNARRPVKLELYDHSEEVRRDLERAFPASHAIQESNPNICLIGQSLDPTEQKRVYIEQADFVFIDPPGWQSKDEPSYPRWNRVLDHVLKPRGHNKRPTLMWMPAGGQERTENKKDPNKENSPGCGRRTTTWPAWPTS
jgi:23S rRNA A2030 N6-methylase RlmJ